MGQFYLQIWVSYLDKYASFLYVTFITPVMFHNVYIPINTGLEVAASSIKRHIVLAIICCSFEYFQKRVEFCRVF